MMWVFRHYHFAVFVNHIIEAQNVDKFRHPVVIVSGHIAKGFHEIIQNIFMNPPFSADEKHILHAYDIAPDGCTIISLCNWATLDRYDHSRSRKILQNTIENYGNAQNLGDVFSIAERKTGVEIGLVKLFKPKSKSETEFEGFFIDEEEEAQFDGLQKYNFVRDVVNRYVGAIKIFDEQLDSALRMNALTSSFFSSKIGLSMNDGDAVKTRAEYKKTFRNPPGNMS